MFIKSSDAIVLRRQDLRETSSLVTFFSKESGKVVGLLKGVRGARVNAAAEPQLLTLTEIVYYQRKKKDICTVSHCELLDFFPLMRADFERLVYGFYCAELVDVSTSVFEPHPELFSLLLGALRFLERPMSVKRIARIFEIKLLDLLGFAPVLGACVHCHGSPQKGAFFSVRDGGLVCQRCRPKSADANAVLPGTVNFLEHVRASDLELVSRIKVADEVGRQVEGLLRGFLDFHLGRPLKTRAFIHQTFPDKQ